MAKANPWEDIPPDASVLGANGGFRVTGTRKAGDDLIAALVASSDPSEALVGRLSQMHTDPILQELRLAMVQEIKRTGRPTEAVAFALNVWANYSLSIAASMGLALYPMLPSSAALAAFIASFSDAVQMSANEQTAALKGKTDAR